MVEVDPLEDQILTTREFQSAPELLLLGVDRSRPAVGEVEIRSAGFDADAVGIDGQIGQGKVDRMFGLDADRSAGCALDGRVGLGWVFRAEVERPRIHAICQQDRIAGPGAGHGGAELLGIADTNRLGRTRLGQQDQQCKDNDAAGISV